MQLTLLRYSDSGDSTQSLLFVDGKFFCHCLEDEYRPSKVSGESRIPPGTYTIELQMIDTPLTEKYRQRYSFFKHHIHIADIPGYQGIYIHVGNTDEHTNGCLLIADQVQNNNIDKNGRLSESVPAYERFYKMIYPKLKSGETVQITCVDLDRSMSKKFK